MATKENPFNEIDELDAQIAHLQERKAKALEGQKASALASIQESIARFGFTAEDLFHVKKRRTVGPPTKRYYDPKSGKEWSGRGKRPAVFKDLGPDELEKFLVK